MPVYEYRCTACSNEFEYEHRMSEKKTTCEQCGGELERLISRTSFAFKGGGWYKDLYASAKPGADSGTGGGDKAAPSSDAAASSDKSSGDKSSGDKGGGSSGGAASGGDSGGSGSGSSTPPASSGSGTSSASAGSSKVASS